MSLSQRALSTKGYYDKKAHDFIWSYDDYRTNSFKTFITNERDRLQSRLKIGTNMSNAPTQGEDSTRFSFPLLVTQTRLYSETLHSCLGCYYSMFGEDAYTSGLECVDKKTYHKRLFEKYNLKTNEDFTEFTQRQNIIESLAFVSALLRVLEKEKELQ